jgi:tetratricopeptide (TPR) repeat protein
MDTSITVRQSRKTLTDSHNSLRDIADELDADALVLGSIYLIGDSIRILTRLLDAETEKLIWSEKYERKFDENILSLQSEVCSAIAENIGMQFSIQDSASILVVRKLDPEAYTNYAMGRFYGDMHSWEGHLRAEEYFRKAIEIDSTFGPAYAGLARHVRKSSPEFDVRMLTKAIQFDPNCGYAYWQLANYLSGDDEEAAEKFYKKAIRLTPTDAEAHLEYGRRLNRWNRPDEALARFREAVKADPHSSRAHHDLGRVLAQRDELELAIAEFNKSVELKPGFIDGYRSQILAYLDHNMFEKALQVVEHTHDYEDTEYYYPLQVKAYIYARWGKRDEAFDLIEKTESRSWMNDITTARTYARIGENDRALQAIERMLTRGHVQSLSKLNQYHDFDGIRSDPRFQQLEKEIVEWRRRKWDPARVSHLLNE